MKAGRRFFPNIRIRVLQLHASYEKETNHGIDESAQLIWNHKINLELDNFGKYSSNRGFQAKDLDSGDF
jgi:hypothetical protein